MKHHVRRAVCVSFRFNETYFEWKPFWKFSGPSILNCVGYVGWLWFCLNFTVYKPWEGPPSEKRRPPCT